MEIQEKNLQHRLEEGQLWKIEHGYVYIVELGKRLIHYKMLRQPGQRAAITQMIGIEALLNFLGQSEAELVMDPQALIARLGGAATSFRLSGGAA